MDIATAQRDISAAHVGGAPGVFVSGIAWITAGLVGLRHGPHTAFAVLFIGGMLIVPGSLLIGRVLFTADSVSPGNPLERLGLESTAVLFAGILIGFVLLRAAPDLAFPALAVAVGARYFAFRTIYGDAAYWVLGGAVVVVSMVAMLQLAALPITPLILIGIVECAFAPLLLHRWKWRDRC